MFAAKWKIIRWVLPPICGFVLAGYWTLQMGMPGLFSFGIGVSAALASCVSSYFFWKRIMWQGETRLRGAYHGAVAGFMAAYLTGLFAGLFFGLAKIFTSGFLPLNVLFSLIYAVIVWPVAVALIGSIVAVPAGAIVGFLLTKNMEPDPQ